MKKITLILSLLSFISNAQEGKKWEVGVQLHNHANKHNGTFLYGQSNNYDYTSGNVYGDIGISTQYYLKDNISLVGELNFLRLNFEKTHNTEGDVVGISTSHIEYFNSKAIEMPLMGRYHYNFGKWKAFANMGITLNYHIGKIESIYHQDSYNSIMPPFEYIEGYRYTTDLTDNFNKFFIGYAAGIGGAYHITPKWLINFEYRISQSLGKNTDNRTIYNNSNYLIINNFKYNTNRLTFGVSYKF